MKNPLTSKERRGLMAVAAAALLCITSGFIFRGIGSHGPGGSASVLVVDNDSVSAGASQVDSVSEKSKSRISNGKRTRRVKRQRAEKTYPSRSPLDEPCD